MMSRNIGLKVEPPKQSCNDPNCPFHGNLPVRGKMFEGEVVSSKMRGTVVVQRNYLLFHKKYNRYERRRSNLSVHNPPCIAAEKGDWVKIAECRPLGKTVAFVVIEKRQESPEDA